MDAAALSQLLPGDEAGTKIMTMGAVDPDRLEFLASKLQAGKLGLFCGAGISMAPPSRLPSWRELASGIVGALAADVPEPDLARLLDAELRPDVVMEILLEVLGDQALGALRVLGAEVPNANHQMIANLARDGGLRCVLTTNFDRLIEIACQQAGVPVRVVVTREDFAEAPGYSGNGLTLYKLHGSIERPETLVASINDLARGLDEAKASCVGQLLAEQHMLFIGYSGQDFAVNADYLMLERAQPEASGFTWNLRPGESDQVLASLLGLYGDRGTVSRSDLPGLLIELGRCAGTAAPEPAGHADAPANRLSDALGVWAQGLPEHDRRFGLGRLYLYSGLWDIALEIMRVYAGQIMNVRGGRETALASYYLAHAHERLHAFNKTLPNIIPAPILQGLTNAERIFARTGDDLMLGRTYNTLARYIGRDPQRAAEASECYARAQHLLLKAGATTELAELMNDMAEQMPFTRPEDCDRALILAGRALDLAQQAGDLRQMTRASSVAGEILLYLERLEDSLTAQDDAVRWGRVLADPAQLQLVTERRGTVLSRLERWEDARSAFTESAELAGRLRLAAREAAALIGLGYAEEQLGALDVAAGHYRHASVIATLAQRGVAFGIARVGAGRVAARARQPQEAKTCALDALFRCENAQWPSYPAAIELLRSATSQLLQARYDHQ